MTLTDLLALLPLVVVAGTAVLLLLLIAFYRHHLATVLLACLGLAAALGLLIATPAGSPRAVTPLLVWDSYAAFFSGLILATTLAVALLSYGYLARQPGRREEYYLLLVTAALGAAVLATSSHLASFFLGLEILSVALYALLAYLGDRPASVEAGLKYLVLAGVSSAMLLFGMALLYAQTGTMAFAELASEVHRLNASPLLLAGLGLLIVGIGFKLAVVPFHMWTADVYQGAPAPVTAFVATVSKGGVLALLLRLSAQAGLLDLPSVFVVLMLIAVLSMLAGNLLALRQGNLKRLLAYSSIAHLGYMLTALLAGGERAPAAVAFYLVAYSVTTLIALGVIAGLSGAEREAERIEDVRGLFWRRPWPAALLAAALLSLAGMPLTAGFVAKFVVVAAGAGAELWLPLGVLVLGSAISVYYYLRVVVAMAAPAEEAPARESLPALPVAGGVTLAVLGLLLLALGIYPAPLLELIERAVASII